MIFDFTDDITKMLEILDYVCKFEKLCDILKTEIRIQKRFLEFV